MIKGDLFEVSMSVAEAGFACRAPGIVGGPPWTCPQHFSEDPFLAQPKIQSSVDLEPPAIGLAHASVSEYPVRAFKDSVLATAGAAECSSPSRNYRISLSLPRFAVGPGNLLQIKVLVLPCPSYACIELADRRLTTLVVVQPLVRPAMPIEEVKSILTCHFLLCTLVMEFPPMHHQDSFADVLLIARRYAMHQLWQMNTAAVHAVKAPKSILVLIAQRNVIQGGYRPWRP